MYTYIYTQVPLDDPNLMFEIFTDEGGFSNGRVYALRLSSPEVYGVRERERERRRRREEVRRRDLYVVYGEKNMIYMLIMERGRGREREEKEVRRGDGKERKLKH